MNNMVNVEFCLGGLLSVYSVLCIMVTSDWGCLHCVVILCPINLPDPFRKCLAYGHYGQCAARIGPTFHIQFGSESPDHFVKNQPGSDLDGLVRF